MACDKLGIVMLATSEDGRVVRSERTRQKIIESLLYLVGRGNLQPRAEEIAAKADIASRTLFRHFEDMDTLIDVTRESLEDLFEAAAESCDVGGSLDERVHAYAASQGRHFERIRPYFLFYVGHAKTVENASRLQATHVKSQRLRLWSSLPECASSPLLVKRNVEHLFSFQCWEQLRHEQKLSPQEAIDTISEGALLFLIKSKQSSSVSL